MRYSATYEAPSFLAPAIVVQGWIVLGKDGLWRKESAPHEIVEPLTIQKLAGGS